MNQNSKVWLGVVAACLVGASIVVGFYFLSLGASNTGRALPNGCVKPSGGYLFIASNDAQYGTGYNDSMGHGAPTVPWPVITVQQGATVTITVCNVDVQAHSFNVIHYLGGAANTIAPGEVKTFQFIATEVGVFTIYCDIFCSIHIYMQNAQLRVTS